MVNIKERISRHKCGFSSVSSKLKGKIPSVRYVDISEFGEIFSREELYYIENIINVECGEKYNSYLIRVCNIHEDRKEALSDMAWQIIDNWYELTKEYKY